jgi:hypothetical protein
MRTAFSMLQKNELFRESLALLQTCLRPDPGGRYDLAPGTAKRIQEVADAGGQWVKQALEALPDEIDERMKNQVYEVALFCEAVLALQACLACAWGDNELGPYYELDNPTVTRISRLLESFEQLGGQDWVCPASSLFPGRQLQSMTPFRVALTGEVDHGSRR